ncbi:MAG: hypothetical protein CVV22_12275 [Ignavibacteriae bacterium HGW-Ignavibacteriae-1]|jgi:uncharacterized delta-60 repeat protein|nr:MAG: hypothetical protein CVV22_12275 [Ignavibacteriae bacterium HGW-Ignavibacteriae-1]
MNKHLLFILLCISLCTSTAFSQIEGSLDLSFEPVLGADGPIHTVAIQPDGKIMIGGGFFNYDGVQRVSIARVNTDGKLDASFDPGEGILWGLNVNTIAVQPDGKIIIAGTFTNYNNNYSERIARLLPDGTFDTSFDAVKGVLGDVNTVAIQDDGKILIGGRIEKYAGVVRKNIVRVNSDGSLDESFNIGTGANSGTSASLVNNIKVQKDGKIMIVGSFQNYNGTKRAGIARLNPDGSLDTSFDPGAGASSEVTSVSVMDNGQYLITGYFNSYGGVGRPRAARLNNDGSVDETFVPEINSTAHLFISKNHVQSDGKVILSGQGYFSRLNSDGTVDMTYNGGVIGVNERVMSFDVQSDNKVVIGGWFTQYNSTPRNRIARLNGEPASSVEDAIQTHFDFFPNPSKGFFTVKSDEIISEISISNMIGQRVYHEEINSNEQEIYTSNLPKGMYSLIVTINGKMKSRLMLVD